MDRAQCLDQAKEIICHQRHNIHGSAENTFGLIADYWSTFLSQKLGTAIFVTPAEVGIMMTLFKIARWQMNPDHQDNVLDGIGYLALAGELQDEDHDGTR